MILTKEQREEIQEAIGYADNSETFSEWGIEQIRKNGREWIRTLLSSEQALREQLDQAERALNEANIAFKWATQYGHLKTCTCPECNGLGSIEYYFYLYPQNQS